VMWHSDNRLDGCKRHLIWDAIPYRVFRTRAECRAHIEERYGYIRERLDLRAEPFGWHMPTAVMVKIEPVSADRK
jgi:hypothetical protein